MKTVYVTYNDKGIIKKGVLSEDKFAKLAAGGVHNVTTYTSEDLMEQVYSQLVGLNSNKSNKDLLMG